MCQYCDSFDLKGRKCPVCGNVKVADVEIPRRWKPNKENVMATETVGKVEAVEPLMISTKPKVKKLKTVKGNNKLLASIQTITCNVTQISEEEFYRDNPNSQSVKPFDSTGGFSKKNGKREVEIEQLKVDKDALEKRVNELAELYKKEHPEPKPWYLSIGIWFAIISGIIVVYLCYWFYVSQGGFPPEITNFFLWVKYYVTGR